MEVEIPPADGAGHDTGQIQDTNASMLDDATTNVVSTGKWINSIIHKIEFI